MSSLDEDLSDFSRAMQELDRRLNMANHPEEITLRIWATIAQERLLPDVVEKRFENEGPDWKPLTDGTVRQRIRQGFGFGPILQRTRQLRDHAVGGTQIVSESGIELQFADGPAPDYTASGKKTRPTRGKKGGKLLSDYAESLNAIRPFYGKLTPEELIPIQARYEELLEKTVSALENGESLDFLAEA